MRRLLDPHAVHVPFVTVEVESKSKYFGPLSCLASVVLCVICWPLAIIPCFAPCDTALRGAAPSTRVEGT